MPKEKVMEVTQTFYLRTQGCMRKRQFQVQVCPPADAVCSPDSVAVGEMEEAEEGIRGEEWETTVMGGA